MYHEPFKSHAAQLPGPMNTSSRGAYHATVNIPTAYADLQGELHLPAHAHGVVIFVHGGGSNRSSPRNQFVAKCFHAAGFGTLLFDLLTRKEQQQDASTSALRFDLDQQTERLVGVTHWLEEQPELHGLKLAYFGSSTGAASALMAAARLGDSIAAVVSRGGRPDLAGSALPQVRCPTLLIVGGYDELVLCLNNEAFEKLRCEKDFRVVPCATHLFAEPGRLEQVAQISEDWFLRHMGISATWHRRSSQVFPPHDSK
ncbi:dienelactone hydrolase family protein [Prosthecobacter sp.]|uniref:dienelactone hydrolase family protein n=1 Tax=Prosthecobacter sp. TaxID=1965333 RepID=UPI003784313E